MSNLFQSIKYLFTKRDAPVASILSPWRRSIAEYSGVSIEKVIDHGWRKNELIHACINKTAMTASQVELKVYDKRDGKELPEHPLKLLIQQPNPEMSEYDFWYMVMVYQQLAGRAFFEKVRDRAGRVVQLYPLRPDWVKVKMLNALQVESYTYQPMGEAYGIPLQPRDVLHFKTWDPKGLFSTWSPAAVAARVGDVDNDTTDLLKSFFQDGGAPMGLLKTEQALTESVISEIRLRWRQRYGGWRNWLDPAVLDRGATFQRIGLTFKEMGFDALDSRSEARICMVFDVPPILIGAKVGLDRATYANYSEARRAWWEDSLMPRYTDLNDVIVNQLIPEFTGTPIKAEWDTSRVPALQEERTGRWTRASTALAAGGITVNEYRAELGLVDIGTAGDIFLRTFNQTAVPVSMKLDTVGREQKSELTTEERKDAEEELETVLSDYFDEQLERLEKAVHGANPSA